MIARPKRLPLPLVALLAGCSTASHIATPVVPATTTGLHGALHGGQQPIVGATINIYAVGTTGDGSVATSVLAAPLTTDANGFFDLTNKVTCPSYSSLTYLVATGGNPGLAPPFNGPHISLITALGQCGNPRNIQFINVNEVTTVAAIYALAPYMSGLASIGSGSGDAASLASAFTLAWQFADITTGAAPGTDIPTGAVVPTALINTLANLLSACVNSSGGTSGDPSVCGQLFALLTPGGGTAPTDAAMALRNLAFTPSLNTSQLYNLVFPLAPFQPTIGILPPDFAVRMFHPSNFTATPSSLSFGSTYIGAQTSTQNVTVTNNTSNAFAVTGVAFSGADPADFVYTAPAQPNTCPTPMLPGTSCTFPIAFQPTTGGARTAYFVISNTSVNPSLAIALSGTGTVGGATSISVSPTSLAFTQFNAAQDVTLTNAGYTTLNINGIRIDSSSVATGTYTETDTCGTSLPAQSICTIHVTAHSNFNGSGAVMTIADDAATGPQTVTLSGPSFPIGAPDSVDFGPTSLGTSSLVSTVFVNPNPSNFIGTIFMFSSPPFVYDSTPGDQCSLGFNVPYCNSIVRFTPTALGPASSVVAYEAPPHNDIGGYIAVKGTGVGPGPYFVASAELSLPMVDNFSPTTSVSFNTGIGIPQTITFKVRRTGTVLPTIPVPIVTGPHASEFTGTSDCTNTSPCTITLTYTPTSPASFTANSAFIEDTNLFQQNFTIHASASGGAITANPTQLNFPDTVGGTVSSPLSSTITSLSGNPVNATLFGPFTITQGASCPSTPCQLSVEFTPSTTSPGLKTGTVTLTDPYSGSHASVYLIGTSTVQTTDSVSAGSLTFPLRPVSSVSIPQTVTVTNTGTTNVLSFGSVTLTGTNPGDYVLTNHCTSNVVPGSSCTIDISFSPTAPGTRTANLSIVSNSTSSPDIVTLSGTAQ